jgi:hypothetical protein
MSLAISVAYVQEVAEFDEEGGQLARAGFERLSRALATEGIEWREPETTPVRPMRPRTASFPYSYLHRLRRVLALVDNGEPVTRFFGSPDVDREDSDRGDLASSHLRWHADNAGYYVPVDFPAPVSLHREKVAGEGLVGSCHGLLGELRRCAPPLGIRLDKAGSLTDEEAARLAKLPETADFQVESTVWLTLFEACRVSIASGHAIVLH